MERNEEKILSIEVVCLAFYVVGGFAIIAAVVIFVVVRDKMEYKGLESYWNNEMEKEICDSFQYKSFGNRDDIFCNDYVLNGLCGYTIYTS